MKAATTRLISLLASLGILAASIFVYTLLLQPAYRHVNELRGDLASYRSALEDQKKITEQVKNLLAEYQSLSSLRDTIARAVPGKEDYPGFVSQISGLANAAQIRLESVVMNPLSQNASGGTVASDFPPPGVLQVTVSATGPYQGMKDFLASIERNIRMMDLVSLGISPPAGANQNLSFIIILNAYYQPL
ncbi:MAG: type 4a pilus biogenesis protein PilO [Patescibacteria group bacterium]